MRKNKNKPTYKAKSYHVVGRTKYPLLCERDSIYSSKIDFIKAEEFRHVIPKLTRELFFLLHFKEADFFEQLSQQCSLRMALQSCLVTFPRKQYQRYMSYQIETQLPLTDEAIMHYEQLMRCVLFIYHRISKSEANKYKDIIYNQWLLDIPKMLDLAAIYGQSNSDIVKDIISECYLNNGSYDNDTWQFLDIVENEYLYIFENQIDTCVDFRVQNKENSKMLEQLEMRTMTKALFSVKQILMNLRNFNKYFPKKHSLHLAIQYPFQQRLLWGLGKFMIKIAQDWHWQTHEKYFKDLIQEIKIDILSYLSNLMNTLKEGIKSVDKEILVEIHATYEMLCLLFIRRKKERIHKYYKQFICFLIESQEKPFFFMAANDVEGISQQSAKDIEACVCFQATYRQKLTEEKFKMNKFNQTFQKIFEQAVKYATKNKSASSVLSFWKTKRVPNETANFVAALQCVNAKEYQDEPEVSQDRFPQIRPFSEYDEQARESRFQRKQQNTTIYVLKDTNQSSSDEYPTALQLTMNESVSIQLKESVTEEIKDVEDFEMDDEPSFQESQILKSRSLFEEQISEKEMGELFPVNDKGNILSSVLGDQDLQKDLHHCLSKL